MQTENEILESAVAKVMAYMREHVNVQRTQILYVQKQIRKLDRKLKELYGFDTKEEAESDDALNTIDKIEQCIRDGLVSWAGFVEKEDKDGLIPARILITVDEKCEILDEPVYFAENGFVSRKPTRGEYILIREKHS